MCLLVWTASSICAQEEGDLLAKRRVFQPVGPGLRAVKRGPDGNYYVLTAPATEASVFDATGKLLKKVPAYEANRGPQSAQLMGITFGEDLDVDASGTVYVADRGANAIKIWQSDGGARMISVNAPVSVAALPEGEIAVATVREQHLVKVFDKTGKVVREFGDPEPITEREELNRYLNIGQLVTDAQAHLYYAFTYLPEPTVRQYDRAGYAGQDIQYTAIEAMPAARAARKEIERQERRGDAPSLRRVITGVGVDRANGEVWIALGNLLLHFDKDGNRRATYKIYTHEGARLEANTILVEADRLIIGNDPLGLHEFERPDKKVP
jgi:DNA-binding beta-propeller fold protein YncE